MHNDFIYVIHLAEVDIVAICKVSAAGGGKFVGFISLLLFIFISICIFIFILFLCLFLIWIFWEILDHPAQRSGIYQ